MTPGKLTSSTVNWLSGTLTSSTTRNKPRFQCSLKEKDYTFFFRHGMESDKLRIYGVGFAVRNFLLVSDEPLSQGT
jgi:hypothetical protein